MDNRENLSDDFCDKVSNALTEQHDEWLDPGEFYSVGGSLGGDYAELSANLHLPDASEIEVISRQVAKQQDKAIEILMDALDAFLASWFEGEREERYPIDFLDYEFNDAKVSIRFRKQKPELESAADKILDEKV